MKKYFLNIHSQYQKYYPLLFFLSGFFFDMFTLRRIDQSFDLIQQGLFLILLCAILCLEIVKIYGGPLKNQLWLHFDEYHVPLFHFVLGALLSAYTIFYFKSSSGILSSFFVILILALLVLNEASFHSLWAPVAGALTSLANQLF
ncbi:MAG: hypothetical protein H6620_03910 [Halobacteriovoraceae bacterium]|nr:hypothetical protein [Halobacteriovoraceae bacterium]